MSDRGTAHSKILRTLHTVWRLATIMGYRENHDKLSEGMSKLQKLLLSDHAVRT
jgi:isoprenylcysteine carboxyl methyltransferase (ICMT) family protein YpbQ